jgi:hypothetical protein
MESQIMLHAYAKPTPAYFTIIAIDYSAGPERPLYCLQCKITQERMVKSAAEVKADAELFDQLTPQAQAIIKLGLDLPGGRIVTCE